MQTLFGWIFKLMLLCAALLFAVSVAIMAVVLLAAWGVRAMWCKITGQPINPLEALLKQRLNPRHGFDQVFRGRAGASMGEGAGEAARDKPLRKGMDDVTDVEPKE
jgi:hypothetical protein